MATKIKPRAFDPAAYLDDDVTIAAYLDEALATRDTPQTVHAIGVVARARGMTDIAEQTGLSRESLYRALSEDGNPGFGTIVRVLATMGIRLSATAEENAPA